MVMRMCKGKQIFRCAKKFCPNFPKPGNKIFVRQTFHEHQKKTSIYLIGRHFFGEKRSKSDLYHSISFEDAKTSVPEFSGIFPEILGTLPRFSTNQNFWGRLHPQFLHHCFNLHTFLTDMLRSLLKWCSLFLLNAPRFIFHTQGSDDSMPMQSSLYVEVFYLRNNA